jgi:DNA-binding response OmpR family regulator
MYSWSQDKRKLALWREHGLVIERLEFLAGNRLRLNNIELELNRAQMQTLRELATKRLADEPLHPAELPGDNGTQLIKRLREELGARLLEKSLIQNRRGKGYWLDMEPSHIRILEEDTEAS